MRKLTRRAAVAAAILTPAVPLAASETCGVGALNLPPELEADLRQRAEVAMREARWLQELPLDDVNPGFVFRPR